MRLAVTLALLFSATAAAQEQRFQAWFFSMAQAPVLGSGMVYIEFQPRGTLLPTESSKVDQVLVRAAVGWKALRTFSIWAGAGFINGEHRFFEQFIWGDNFGPVRLSVRARLEQRFLPNETTARHRARVQLRAAWTFRAPFLLIVYEEPFVDLPFTFEQNRAYLALGYRPHPDVLLELGYLNQYLPTRMGHTAIFTVGVGF